jgi:hypothetical protein
MPAWLVLTVVAWCVVSLPVGVVLGRVMKNADRAEQPEPDLLADVPAECLSDAEIRRRCDRIEAEMRHPSSRTWYA